MTNQLFRQVVSTELLFKLLDALCVKTDKHYIFDNVAFRRGMYSGSISVFNETCKPCYHKSKQKYLNCPTTYRSFLTVVRQICNINNVAYTSKLVYDKSSYDIVYMIVHN